MDGQDKTKTTPAAPDASETILQQQRGDDTNTPPTTEAVEAATPGSPAQPAVDLSARDTNAARQTVPTEAPGLARATVEGNNILFGDEEIVTEPGRGALVKAGDPPASAATAERATTPGAAPAAEVTPPAPGQPPAPEAVDPERASTPEAALNPENPGEKVKLPDDVEKDIAAKMIEFQKKLEGDNYSIQFERGEGPWNAITRQQTEAAAKLKAGKPLTPQEQAILGLKPDDVTKEARAIRDRDFLTMKTEDGKPRTWYKLHEATNRWSPEQMKEMMAKQEQTLRQTAERAVKEAEAKAREAEARAEAEKQAALAAKVEKNVPAEAIVKDAATAAGIEGDPKVIRDAMKAQVAQEVKDGTLTDADLEKPYPRVGAALVGTGALNAEELKSALAKQTELKTEAEAKGEKGPRLDAVLKDIYKDDPERLGKIEKASKFYDELKRLTDAAIKAEAPAAPAAPESLVMDDPFATQYTDLIPKPAPAAPEAPTPAPGTTPDAPPPGPETPPAVPNPPAEGKRFTVPGQPEAPTSEQSEADKRRADLLRKATDAAAPATDAAAPAGVVTDLKQQPSGLLALKAFQSAGLDTRTWSSETPAGKALAANLANPALKEQIKTISAEMLDGKASVGTVDPVNEFLKQRGLNIELKPIGENEIAFASALKVKGAWAGTETSLNVDGKTYPAVDLKNLESYKVGDQQVVKLYTGEDGTEVYATPMPEDVPGEELLARAKRLSPNGTNSRPGDFSAARIPMVKMDARTDLKDLVGMTSDKGETITTAQMQTLLNLDQNGFSVEQGLAVTSTRSIAQSMTFDKPFMLWVKMKGSDEPLTAVRVDERFWKNPKA